MYRFLRWWSIIVLLFSHNMGLLTSSCSTNPGDLTETIRNVDAECLGPLHGLAILYSSTTSPQSRAKNESEWIRLALYIDKKNWWRSYCTPSYHLDQFKKSRCNVIQRGLLHHSIDQHVLIATERLNGNSEAFAASSCLLFLLCPGELQWKSISSWWHFVCHESDHLETRKMLASLHWFVLTCLSWGLTFIKLRCFL